MAPKGLCDTASQQCDIFAEISKWNTQETLDLTPTLQERQETVGHGEQC